MILWWWQNKTVNQYQIVVYSNGYWADLEAPINSNTPPKGCQQVVYGFPEKLSSYHYTTIPNDGKAIIKNNIEAIAKLIRLTLRQAQGDICFI
jgi:hypothetical protein